MFYDYRFLLPALLFMAFLGLGFRGLIALKTGVVEGVTHQTILLEGRKARVAGALLLAAGVASLVIAAALVL